MERLKTRSQFQAVLAGSIVARTPHFALHVLKTGAGDVASVIERDAGKVVPQPHLDPSQVWVGALIPKRWAKRAATRNAIRRQIYDAGRDLDAAVDPLAMVVRLRAAFDRTRFKSASSEELKKGVRVEVEQLFNRIKRKCAGQAA